MQEDLTGPMLSSNRERRVWRRANLLEALESENHGEVFQNNMIVLFIKLVQLLHMLTSSLLPCSLIMHHTIWEPGLVLVSYPCSKSH